VLNAQDVTSKVACLHDTVTNILDKHCPVQAKKIGADHPLMAERNSYQTPTLNQTHLSKKRSIQERLQNYKIPPNDGTTAHSKQQATRHSEHIEQRPKH